MRGNQGSYIISAVALMAMVMFILWVFCGRPLWAAEPAQKDDNRPPSDRIERLESVLEEMGVEFSSALEVEAGYVDDDRADGQTSDITLGTAEIGLDMQPVKHVSGYMLILFEEEESDPIDLEEAFLRLDGENWLPLSVKAGRQYLPFGYFESHFISDPLTLELGETRQTALVAGYSVHGFDIALGLFNGDVSKTGEKDDHIDGYVASGIYTMPGGKAFDLATGLSYTSNLGDSDNLQGPEGVNVDEGDTIDSYVPGLAFFVSANYKEKLFTRVEYVTAIDEFKAGELGFDSGRSAQPSAINFEFSYLVYHRLKTGLRLGGAGDAGAFLPEFQYGVVVSFDWLDNLSLALEYQHGTFDTPDDKDISTLTTQLALEF